MTAKAASAKTAAKKKTVAAKTAPAEAVTAAAAAAKPIAEPPAQPAAPPPGPPPGPASIHPLPGLDVVGRGIQLKPHQPYMLRRLLVPQQESTLRAYYSPDTGRTFSIPAGYEIHESAPMPAGQALNRVIIEESFQRFEKQFALDAKVAASTSIFSIDANFGETNKVRSEEDAYYALRNSFIPLWALYLAKTPTLPENAYAHLPDCFDHDDRAVFEKFFARFGTHFVRRAWVGGEAKLAFTISKAADLSKQDIHAGIKASLSGLGEGAISESLSESKERLQNSSECTVWGKGGAEQKLAALSTLDQLAYNQWLESISHNPQVIEIELKGIWTLVEDPKKSQTLRDAYEAETGYPPLSAAFVVPRQQEEDSKTEWEALFVSGDKYFAYNLATGNTAKPRPIGELWPALAEFSPYFDSIDAAYCEPFFGEYVVFSGNRCVTLDSKGKKAVGEPQTVGEKFPGVHFSRIDAVLLDVMEAAIYFFHGSEYIRYDMLDERVADGYPDLISRRWVGVTFDRIDAALYRLDTGKVYFFHEDQYIRYDMCTYHADPGYPKFIVGSYVEDWRL